MSKEKEELLEETKKRMPDVVQTLGYMEHQLDLVTKLTLDIHKILVETTQLVNAEELTPEQRERFKVAEDFVKTSSVDFDDLPNQLQSYKLPTAIQKKSEMRQIQDRYLQVVYERGLNDKK